MRRAFRAAVVLAFGATFVSAGMTLAAFQVVTLSATSGDPGAEIDVRVDASHLIGGAKRSEIFLIRQRTFERSPEPARCDEIPSARVVGELRWHAASVEFQLKTYPGFVANGIFTVPDVERGIYVLTGILDDEYTGCHVFSLFGVGMEVPDTAVVTSPDGPPCLTILGSVLLAVSVVLGRQALQREKVLARAGIGLAALRHRTH